MDENINIRYKIDWVLQNEIALGIAPKNKLHLDILRKEGIKSILSLCSEEEEKSPEGMSKIFKCRRFVLPDHTYKQLITANDLSKSLEIIVDLKKYGPIFVHCVASVERSPLVCMAWLIKKHNLSLQQALDYLMSIHAGTNPLTSQLKILNEI